MTNGTSSCKVVLAGSIAKSLLEEVRDGLSRLDRKPQLHGFLANQDPAAKMYADWTAKTCKEKYVLSSLHRNILVLTDVKRLRLHTTRNRSRRSRRRDPECESE